MRFPPFRVVWIVALLTAVIVPASAKIEDWKDPQGNAFKAEPAEELGPFALFRTAAGGGRRLPWRALTPADCVRFEQQLTNRPARAPRWADANGELTGRLRGHLGQYEGVTLVAANLDRIPEPEMLIVFYVDNSASGAWDMIGKGAPLYQALQAKFPGRMSAIQFGATHSMQEHNDMALRAKTPWLLVDYDEQGRINLLSRLAPRRQEFSVYALSRAGVPIFGVENPDEAAVKQFFADADALLGLLAPGNPHTWADRAHYLGALHAARHQQDSAGPLLVGNPLVAQGLRDRGIRRVAADVAVGADGKVTAVVLKDESTVPEPMRKPLITALQRSAVFVAAVDHGKFVAGTYDYLVEVPN